jgi:hypothetical protein
MQINDLRIHDSYRGEELVPIHSMRLGDTFIINGRIIIRVGILEDSIRFQVPCDEKELRLARVIPHGWVLVNEKTMDAWKADADIPINRVKITQSLSS